jgi:multidrug efflux system membrane fusion protein
MSRRRLKILKVLAPIAVLSLGAIGSVAMVRLKPEVETKIPERKPPLVRVQEATFADRQLNVMSQGTVAPRNESQLVPEVSGRVIWVSDSLAAGGFFEKGEILLKIDPYDYEQAVIRAEADVARAKLRLAQEEAEARVARKEWNDLGSGPAKALALREPQLEEARAALAASEAALDKAKRDLERTRVRAPYAGRVRNERVDVGQFVSVGSPVATLYSVDYAEVRLPVPSAELAYLDLPLDYRGKPSKESGPKVTLRADFAGKTHVWDGRIVRTEGEIDPTSRMVHVVAQVKDPYGKGDDPDRPPLAVGLFVQAEIEGRLTRDVAALPRSALRGKDTVLVVDSEARLRFRQVDLLRATDEEIVIRSGLEPGEKVCLSSLEAVTDGMEVRMLDEAGLGGGQS